MYRRSNDFCHFECLHVITHKGTTYQSIHGQFATATTHHGHKKLVAMLSLLNWVMWFLRKFFFFLSHVMMSIRFSCLCWDGLKIVAASVNNDYRKWAFRYVCSSGRAQRLPKCKLTRVILLLMLFRIWKFFCDDILRK